MPSYELAYILRPDLDPETLESLVMRVNQRITEQGGHIEVQDIWGKRRLAYTIKKYREGHYVVTRFGLDGRRLPEVKRSLQLIEEILRLLVVVAEGPPPKPAAAARPEEPAAAAPAGEKPGDTPAAESGSADAAPAATAG
ncbi:MAG: 30S ribosomal protein S6 [Armatimonadetes bacterium]|nr:30S ribosomal protein S6 [Armatimonadota bacterium]